MTAVLVLALIVLAIAVIILQLDSRDNLLRWPRPPRWNGRPRKPSHRRR